ncbi:MAG: 4Fe-4S dicluster domain-containing protein [Minisyncoccia bacterium]|jgi:carbon-monoxide dehydrogenase iron sulfur subunit
MTGLKKVFIEMERCVGCKSCEIACQVEHSQSKDIYQAIFELPKPRRFDTVLKFQEFNASLRCAHCEDAPCVNVCPTGALTHDEDTHLVVYDTTKCIGCWQCAMVCPFGAIYPNYETLTATKCDGCINRVKNGKIPACVEACPTNALIYADVDEMEQYKREHVVKELIKGPKTSIYNLGVI